MLERMLSAETGYLAVPPGARVALLVNSLGASTPMELNIVARAALRTLADAHQVRLISWKDRQRQFSDSGHTSEWGLSKAACGPAPFWAFV